VVTTPSVPPGRPEDHDDPTGVRALLAGLGDPGPMPADLVERINASIAAEQRARSVERTVVPLRRRRPSWPKVGLAAAAVAAVAVGVPALLGTGPGNVLASLGGDSSSSADSAAGSASAPLESAAPRTDAGNRALSDTGAVTLVASGTAYTSAALGVQARTVLDHAPSGHLGTKGDPASSVAGLRDCLTALGVATWMPVTGDVGTFDGRPAVVAVVGGDTGQSVYAVGTDCDASHPTIIAGPVPLG
jgi:hypothetical protein